MERGGEGVGEVGRGSDLSFEVIGSLKVRIYNKKCLKLLDYLLAIEI